MKARGNFLGAAFDFAALTLLFAAISFSVFFARLLLFGEAQKTGDIAIITETVPLYFDEKIKVGDTVYDTLTKRRVGVIKSVSREYSQDGVSFTITADASRRPSSDTLRTRELWFKIKLWEAL